MLYYIFIESVSKVTAVMTHRYGSLVGYGFNII
jgi:hypothetical protein